MVGQRSCMPFVRHASNTQAHPDWLQGEPLSGQIHLETRSRAEVPGHSRGGQKKSDYFQPSQNTRSSPIDILCKRGRAKTKNNSTSQERSAGGHSGLGNVRGRKPTAHNTSLHRNLHPETRDGTLVQQPTCCLLHRTNKTPQTRPLRGRWCAT